MDMGPLWDCGAIVGLFRPRNQRVKGFLNKQQQGKPRNTNANPREINREEREERRKKREAAAQQRRQQVLCSSSSSAPFWAHRLRRSKGSGSMAACDQLLVAAAHEAEGDRRRFGSWGTCPRGSASMTRPSVGGCGHPDLRAASQSSQRPSLEDCWCNW